MVCEKELERQDGQIRGLQNGQRKRKDLPSSCKADGGRFVFSNLQKSVKVTKLSALL